MIGSEAGEEFPAKLDVLDIFPSGRLFYAMQHHNQMPGNWESTGL
jgi:hypothetical protein